MIEWLLMDSIDEFSRFDQGHPVSTFSGPPRALPTRSAAIPSGPIQDTARLWRAGSSVHCDEWRNTVSR
ncbi:hypothetical protein GCM10025331_66080 [Actinoplanes utahensis]|uniref:Uncharacterized protein n=1 Tax=Actinoplanes utahensis TaxID=1869 RepID=A0A0A6UR04_ACTUT|nr:hypothetical protein MB27_08635 [Actinoplanes utahensis]GIF32477.1 hypothetical protein Aut01nite_54630 [Actinoplanes utahensis]